MHTLTEIVERILKEYLHVRYEPQPKGLKVCCPFHDDKTPSGQLYIDETSTTFTCFVCDNVKQIPFERFVAKAKNSEPQAVLQELERIYGYELGHTLDAKIIEKYHKFLWHENKFLNELKKRGVTESLIKKYRLGFNSGRITIPITNKFGLFVNLRRYKPGAPGPQKMRNQTHCGKKPRLFPIEQLEYDKIVLCGGEIKAIVAANELNQYDIGAISTTTGETNWYPEFNESFRDKTVYVCHDIDTPGQNSAKKVCNALSVFAKWVGNINLPLDAEKFPNGDINDYIAQCGGSLHPLLEKCERWVPDYQKNYQDTNVYDVSLNQAIHARFTNKRVKLSACVTAVHEAPYSVPRTVRVCCDRSTDVCGLCPIAAMQGEPIRSIEPESAQLLEMIGAPANKQGEALKSALQIPKRCRVVTFDVMEYHHAEDCRISPQLSLNNRDTDREMLPAIFVGNTVELNESYELHAKMYPHPKNQVSTMLVSKYSPTEDTLNTYQCKEPEKLKIFQVEKDTEEAIDEKLNDIYLDFEANVTQIYLRRDIHLITDLTYHSLLNVYLRTSKQKGWVESLIIGDSAQGKTETVTKMMNHYRLGVSVDCKNATVAGLIGGLQAMDKRWFVTWGEIPTHDKRLVHLEELKGLDVEIISKMTEMRSSGVAQLPKIENKKKLARTRLIATSNPRDNRRLQDRTKGVYAVRDLVGNLEDVRRFDIVLGVSSKSVDIDQINEYQIEQPAYEHKYTSDLCHDLVLFAWTCDTAIVEDDKHLLRRAIDLSKNLQSTEIPLIDAGSVRWKLLRLSTALACRLFSVNDTYDAVIVKPYHVDYIFNLFHRLYKDPALDYSTFVIADSGEVLREPEELRSYVANLPYARDYIRLTLEAGTHNHEDIQDWCNYTSVDDARDVTSYLIRAGAIRKRGRFYVNTPKYIEFLKELLQDESAFPQIPNKGAREDEF